MSKLSRSNTNLLKIFHNEHKKRALRRNYIRSHCADGSCEKYFYPRKFVTLSDSHTAEKNDWSSGTCVQQIHSAFIWPQPHPFGRRGPPIQYREDAQLVCKLS